VELTRSFTPEQFAQGLESWQWISIGAKTLLFTSPPPSATWSSRPKTASGFWIPSRAASPGPGIAPARKTDLATASGQDRYLLAGLAIGAEHQGLIPAPGQVYGFKTPPVLGGTLDLGNVEVIDFVVGLHLAGQLHDQVRRLPPGTRISGFTISGDSP
jgi:hypothetical protein